MTDAPVLHLFQGIGIELEYMIVDAETLSVKPIADLLLQQVGGLGACDCDLGPISWSNELAHHVIELKTNGPSRSLAGLGKVFQTNIEHINQKLAKVNARLLPTAMHPWMNPEKEFVLWPHGGRQVYQAFHRIFHCGGHGWANLQSMHINLPFADDSEFGRLHAAMRVVLPIIPGLAASSPYADGLQTPYLDTRLAYYQTHTQRVFSVSGQVIPEPLFTRREYEELLARIYKDLTPYDPEGVLHHEWVNARGCIARFDRMAIEIRLIDLQESPQADIAIAAAVIETIHALLMESWASSKEQRQWNEIPLAAILAAGIKDADQAIITQRPYLDLFGFPEKGPTRVHELWQYLIETLLTKNPLFTEWRPTLETYIREGCLARRIIKAAELSPSSKHLFEIYARLANSLSNGQPFCNNIHCQY